MGGNSRKIRDTVVASAVAPSQRRFDRGRNEQRASDKAPQDSCVTEE